MAKQKRGAKSQAIRDELAANPTATPKDIVAACKAKGIKVSSQMVSTLKAKVAGSGKKKKPGRKKAGSSMSDMVDSLVKAKKLADQMGGIEQAKEALAALEKLG